MQTTYTISELAVFFRVTPETVRRMIRSGEIKALRTGRGRRIIVTAAALNDYLNKK